MSNPIYAMGDIHGKIHPLDQALASDFTNTPATSTAGDASAPLLETLRDFVWASHLEPGYAARHAVSSKA